MAQLTTIREALAQVITDGIDDVVGYAHIPDSVNVPCVVAEPGSPAIDYLEVMRSSNAEWTIDLLILASRPNELAGQELIDELASPTGTKSIPALLASDPTLGGVVAYAVATEMSEYGRFTIALTEYLGCRIEVQVNA